MANGRAEHFSPCGQTTNGYSALEPASAPGAHQGCEVRQWQSSAAEPALVLACDVPAGWVRVRFDIETASKCPIELYVDTGSDFHSAEVLTIHSDQRSFTSDKTWFIPKPIRAIRLAPADQREPFRLRSFTIRPVSSATFYRQAVVQLLRQAAGERHLLKVLRKGLQALVTGDFRRIAQQVRGRSQLVGIDSTYDYSVWIEKHEITPARRRRMHRQLKRWTAPPKISVLLPLQGATESRLRASLASIGRQLYPHWELIVTASTSLDPASARALDEYARAHSRIRVRSIDERAGEAEALNHALGLASGTFAMALAAGDELAEHALFEVARATVDHPQVDWIYSDEDCINALGQRVDPKFKPDWSPELALASPYTGRLAAFRVSLLRALGGWRANYEGAHHYDLALRVMRLNVQVSHVADVLYHAQAAGTSSGTVARRDDSEAARHALEEHCRQTGIEGAVEPGALRGMYRVRRRIDGRPLVSVVIPTASKPMAGGDRCGWYVLNCIRSIRDRSSYGPIEIIVVDNNDMPCELSLALRSHDVVKVSYTRPFNLAAKINLGAARASGRLLVYMNDDIEILTRDWVEGMLEYAQQPSVGAVGVRLLFPNDAIQHAGVVWTPHGPEHLFYNETQASLERYPPAFVPRELTAVTGACVMVKRRDHDLVGGWNEALPLNFNDIDLCLKLLALGRRNVYTPFVTMRHYESVSKTQDDKVDASILREWKTFMKIWRAVPPRDPYYSPHFLPVRPFYRINTLSRPAAA